MPNVGQYRTVWDGAAGTGQYGIDSTSPSVVILSHEDATGLGAFTELANDGAAFSGEIEQIVGLSLLEQETFSASGLPSFGSYVQAQMLNGTLSASVNCSVTTSQAQSFVCALLTAIECVGTFGQGQSSDAIIRARTPAGISAGGGKLAAGRLNKRLELQDPVPVRTMDGAEVLIWITFATVWAEIKPISSPETVDAQQLDARPACDITIRWRSDVSASTRIVHKQTIYNVLDVRDFGAYLVLRCEREAASP